MIVDNISIRYVRIRHTSLWPGNTRCKDIGVVKVFFYIRYLQFGILSASLNDIHKYVPDKCLPDKFVKDT